jgi:hypothetical protein
MDRSYLVVARMREENGSALKPVVGVLFTNSAPDKKTLVRLGFIDIQTLEQVKKDSAQPDEPTLYVFERKPFPAELTIIRTDGAGNVKAKEKVFGNPADLIPEVSGSAVERFIRRSGISKSDFPKKLVPPHVPQPPSARRRQAY